MRKEKYRQAAACFLTAALVLSGGPVQSVLAEAENVPETVRQEQGASEEESTVPVTPVTEVPKETEPQTVPLTEQNTETGPEKQTEQNTETETEKQTEQNTEKQTEQNTEIEPEKQTGQNTEIETETEKQTESETTGETSGEGEPETEDNTEPETESKDIPPAQAPSITPAQSQTPETFNSLTAVSGTVSDTQTADSVAELNGKYYTDFMEAVNAAYNTNYDCKLLKDVMVNGDVGQSLDQNPSPPVLSIDLNGYTLTCSTLYLNGSYMSSSLHGPGTVKGNIELSNGMLEAPITVNGNITSSGAVSFFVSGSGVLRVNGNIGSFSLRSEIDSSVTIICTGICGVTDIQDQVITQPKNITLKADPEGSGSVTASGNKVAMDSGNAIASAGSTVTLSAAANQDYQFKEWKVESGGVTINNDNTFTMPDSDVTIKAVFESAMIGTNVQLTVGSVVSGGAAAYESSIDLEATVTGGGSSVNGGTVDFYRGEVKETNKLNTAGITVENGTAKLSDYQITGEEWEPSNMSYQIIAVYTPESGSNLQGSTATATLTVNKAASSAPAEKEGYIIDYEAKKVTADEGYELSSSNDESAEGSKELTVTPGTDIYIRKAETSFYLASDWVAVDISGQPALTLKVTDISAKGFTVTVDGEPSGAELTYQAKADGEYFYDSGEQKNGTFTGLKAGMAYQVSVKCAATSSSFSAESTKTVTTNGASYTVSIPGKATAGGNPVSISIQEDSEHPFDLGDQGAINVKIKDNGTIKDGSLILTREGASNTVTSALSVGEKPFKDLSQNVATFTEDNKGSSVGVSFAAPSESNIPAGTYQGSVNFEISYTQ